MKLGPLTNQRYISGIFEDPVCQLVVYLRESVVARPHRNCKIFRTVAIEVADKKTGTRSRLRSGGLLENTFYCGLHLFRFRCSSRSFLYCVLIRGQSID